MKCLECEGDISLPEDALEGEIITCPDCGSSFELFKNKKHEFHLRPIQAVGEDWGE